MHLSEDCQRVDQQASSSENHKEFSDFSKESDALHLGYSIIQHRPIFFLADENASSHKHGDRASVTAVGVDNGSPDRIVGNPEVHSVAVPVEEKEQRKDLKERRA
ncbi:hypothetical protein EW145_g1423 [Phellinidium pouzarii]|uniref:Uncharacterized protein n=1 Tax=Phellinidium pouzarii TaxID=167371 RepID=A0A4S4LEZ6_9AGAM|nr:hypothetical protein EW145_g1423 [Phellinidium pouzarii]